MPPDLIRILNLGAIDAVADGDFFAVHDLSAGSTKKASGLQVKDYARSQEVAFSAYRTGASNTGNNAHAKVTLNNVVYNHGGNFDTSTGTFTAPYDGIYQFVWGATITTTSTNQTVIGSLFKNGSELHRGWRIICPPSGGLVGGNGMAVIELLAGDQIELYMYGTVALAIEHGTPGQAILQGRFIGEGV